MKKFYDVIVIGGGPAGFAASYTLYQDGLDFVWVYPRIHKGCTSLLTDETIKWFQQECLEEILEKASYDHEKHDLIYYDNSNKTIIKIKRNYILNVDRKVLELEMWATIPQSKTVNAYVKDIIKDTNKQIFNVILNKNHDTLSSKYVIVCTGANPKFIPKQYLQHRIFTAGINDYYTFKGSNKLEDVIFVIDRNKVKLFYIWIVQKGSHIVVGRPKHISSEVARMVAKETLRDLGYENIKLEKIANKTGGTINLPLSEKAIYYGEPGKLVTGEAMGLTTLTTGKGIPFALYSGSLAGKCFDNFEEYKMNIKPIIDRIISKITEGRNLYNICN